MSVVSEANATAAAVAVPAVVDPSALRLRVARKEAAGQLGNQLKIGKAIRGQRIRDRWELDQARAEKQEWVRRTTETIETIFNEQSATLVEQLNDWTGPILPEYAELELFIELFDDEMRHRLAKLQEIARSVDDSPEPGPIATAAAAAASSPMTTESKESVMSVQTAPPVATAPAHPQASANVSERTVSLATGVLIVRDANPPVVEAVEHFLSQLGLKLIVLEPAGKPSAA